jgi:general secretion pathway protein A
MYEKHFGLRERPFELTSDPKFLLLTPKHREALSNLQYGICGRRGITLLLGEAGTGKTSIIAAALQGHRHGDLRVAHLANPTLTREEFFELLAHAYGLSAEAARSKSRFLLELQATLEQRQRQGGLTALIIDEAQSLPDVLLEEVRLLANVESTTEKLLPVVLAGQPELSARLNEPGLRQLKQRVALRCTLAPLDLRETAAYISNRLRTAGGDSLQVFTREAVIAIHAWSGGIPRTINVICDNVLLSAFALNQRPANASLVVEVCRDFDLQPPAGDRAANPAPAIRTAAEDSAASDSPADTRAVAAAAVSPVRSLFRDITARRRFSFFERS